MTDGRQLYGYTISSPGESYGSGELKIYEILVFLHFSSSFDLSQGHIFYIGLYRET